MNDVFSQSNYRQPSANPGSFRGAMTPYNPFGVQNVGSQSNAALPRAENSASTFGASAFPSAWMSGAHSSVGGGSGAGPHHVSGNFASRHGAGYNSPKAVKLPDDPVSQLNYYVSKSCLPPARFELLGCTGPSHDPQFTMQVCIADRKFGPYLASNTKVLKKICAANALRSYFAVECEIPSASSNAAGAATDDKAKTEGARLPENAVQRLTQLTQLLRVAPPQFSVVTDYGPPHKKLFEIQCDVQLTTSRIVANGRGSSKHDAKADSASQALQQLEAQGLTLERIRSNRETDKRTNSGSAAAATTSTAAAANKGSDGNGDGQNNANVATAAAGASRKASELDTLKGAPDVREALRALGTTKNYVQLLYEIATALKRNVTFCCEEEAESARRPPMFRAYWTVGERSYTDVSVSSRRKQDAKVESAARTIECLLHEIRGDSSDATPSADAGATDAGPNVASDDFVFTQPTRIRRIDQPLMTKNRKLPPTQRTNDAGFNLGREALNDVRTDAEIDVDVDFDQTDSNAMATPAQLVNFADSVQNLVISNFGQALAHFASTPFAFPSDRVRHVVAAVVMTTKASSGGKLRMQLVALGAGRKTIHGDCFDTEGSRIYDSHAEVLARRGLLRFLVSELGRAASSNAGDEVIFERDASTAANGFRLKKGVHFHMYVSTAPCGDSRCFAPLEADPQWSKPNQSDKTDGDAVRPRGDDLASLVARHEPQFTKPSHGSLRCKIENSEGTVPASIFRSNGNTEAGNETKPTLVPNVVPTWDGLMGGEQLLTMSCSDKFAKWNILGLQGNLLSHLISEPIYLRSLIIGDRGSFRPSHIVRAVCCRLEARPDAPLNEASNLEAPYRVQHPVIVACSQPPPLRSRWPPTACCVLSLNWNLIDATAAKPTTSADSEGQADWRVANAVELLDNRTGLLLTDAAHSYALPGPECPESARYSRLSRRHILIDFLKLCDSLANESSGKLKQHVGSLLTSLRGDARTYADAKHFAGTYIKAQRAFLARMRRYGIWIPKPIELAAAMTLDVEALLAKCNNDQ